MKSVQRPPLPETTNWSTGSIVEIRLSICQLLFIGEGRRETLPPVSSGGEENILKILSVSTALKETFNMLLTANLLLWEMSRFPEIHLKKVWLLSSQFAELQKFHCSRRVTGALHQERNTEEKTKINPEHQLMLSCNSLLIPNWKQTKRRETKKGTTNILQQSSLLNSEAARHITQHYGHWAQEAEAHQQLNPLLPPPQLLRMTDFQLGMAENVVQGCHSPRAGRDKPPGKLAAAPLQAQQARGRQEEESGPSPSCLSQEQNKKSKQACCKVKVTQVSNQNTISDKLRGWDK